MQKENYRQQKLYKGKEERTVTSAVQAAELRAQGWSDTKPVVAASAATAPKPTPPNAPMGNTDPVVATTDPTTLSPSGEAEAEGHAQMNNEEPGEQKPAGPTPWVPNRPGETKPFVTNPFTGRDTVAEPVEAKTVSGALGTDFPGREILVAAGLDTVEKVKAVFGDKGVNAEVIAKIQTALRATV